MSKPEIMHRLLKPLGAPAPKAPLVAFIHGFMGAPGDWKPVADALAGQFDLAGITLPGHAGVPHAGEDFEATATEIAHEIGVMAAGRPAIVVGYSMGGRFALYLGLRHPERFKGLFIESATPGIADEHAREARRQHDDAHARNLDAVESQGEFEAYLAAWYAAPPFDDLDESQRATLIAHRLKNTPSELSKAIRAFSVGRQPDLWQDLPNLSIPMLVVCGEKDHKYCRIAEEMTACSPRIAMQTILDCGHNVHLEQPDAYTKVLRGFLDGVL